MTTPEEPKPVYGTPEWDKMYSQPMPNEREFWIEQIREEGEKEHDECMEKFGTLDCPHCCGSGHIGDVKNAQEPVAWTNASWLSNPHAGHFSAKKTDCFNVPLFTTPPQHQAAMKLALEALRELADCGADAWSAERPCVKDGYAAIAALEGVL